MLQDKAGNRLWRKVKIKVIFPDNIFPPKVFIQHAGPRQGFGPDGTDDMLMKVADYLEELYPFWNFKMQEMTPEHRTARYLMTFAGYRATPASAQPPTNSTTPEAETAAQTPSLAQVLGDFQ
jgi:hypothetical protein